MAAPLACQNCGEEARHKARGLCPVCYGYWWRTGRTRPAYLWDGGTRLPCRACGGRSHYQRVGWCQRCYDRERKRRQREGAPA